VPTIGELNLPESLVGAQRAGELVIFAGAGVSMGAPANLPSFPELVKRVAVGSLLERRAGEGLDGFLGRLADQGTDVQGLTRRIIGNVTSRPSPLHHDLLGLFRGPGDVRIVTTNFDTHFSTAARERFPTAVDTYCGPALPLGHDLMGIVHLHGSIAHRHPLILTDREFGQAYLSEGWATRMLVDMFARYTVLFVGYSHEDPVMGYLARSLVRGTSRFVLTPDGADQKARRSSSKTTRGKRVHPSERWIHLGITPLTYTPRPKPDEHGALVAGVRAWAARAAMGALEHEHRVREIVQGPPPIDVETADYIESALHDPVALQFFAANATTVEWLRWAETKGALDRLFQTATPLDDGSRPLVNWLVARYVLTHPADALALVQRQGLMLHPDLVFTIAHRLTFAAPRPAPEIISRWTVVLLQSGAPDAAAWLLSRLLTHRDGSVDRVTALLLFQHLTRPRVRLERYRDTTERHEPRLNVAIALHGDHDLLSDAWREILLPQMAALSTSLHAVLTAHIENAHVLLRGAGGASADWDPSSFARRSIAAHEQDQRPGQNGHLGVLIDGARDVIEWMTAYEPESGRAVIAGWGQSDAPLLRRLAIHGLVTDRSRKPDDKIDLMIARRWLYALPLKHEVFALLQAIYPLASTGARKRLIQCSMEAEAVTAPPTETPEARRTREYGPYNIAVWLARIAPDCPLATRHLAAMQKAHPEFGPRDHPDFDVWFGPVGWVVPESPVTVAELLAKPAAEWVDFFVEYRGAGEAAGPTSQGLWETARDAVTKSFDWGLDLAAAFRFRAFVDCAQWGYVLEGWQRATLTTIQWHQLLEFLETATELDPCAQTIMAVLERAFEVEADAITPADLTTLQRIIDRLADARTNDAFTAGAADHGWLFLAINHVTGRATMLALRNAAKRHADAGLAWTGLSEDERARFSQALNGDGPGAEASRVILGSQMASLYALDASWSVAHIAPLFDWTRDAGHAEQAWQGYVGWGQWNDAVLGTLLPALLESFGHLESGLLAVRDEFCQRLAGMAVYSSINPLTSEWLPRFIADTTPDTRARWAAAVGQELQGVPPNAGLSLWQAWMDEYWTRRLAGLPLPLADQERLRMTEWVVHLPAVFVSAVDHVCATSAPVEEYGLLFSRLADSGLARTQPTPLVRLVAHVLESNSTLHSDCQRIATMMRAAHAAGADRQPFGAACQQMAQHGCPEATELRNLIEDNGDD
jgi:hypothetical protein